MVRIMLIVGSIVLPILMFYLQKHWVRLRGIYNLIAIIAVLAFGNIASLSIYKIIKDGTVFMTAIHGIFLNPFFLMTLFQQLNLRLIGLLILQVNRSLTNFETTSHQKLLQFTRSFFLYNIQLILCCLESTST